MKKSTTFFSLSTAALLIVGLQAAEYKSIHTEKDERDVLQLESQWTKALQTGDAASLERLLAPNYTQVDAAGKTLSKAQEIAMYTSGDLKLDSLQTSEQSVKIYHGGAVVTGKASIKGKYKGEEIDGDYRFVDVLEPRRGGGWHAVYSQITKVETEKDKKKADQKKEAN